MKITMSGINTILLSLLLGVASFIGVKVWDINGDQRESSVTMLYHTKQISAVQQTASQAVHIGNDNGLKIALLQQTVDGIKRKN